MHYNTRSKEEETYKLRRNQRKRELARALGKQRALYGISGVKLENTPVDVLASTASAFAEDDFYDRYEQQAELQVLAYADNLRKSGEQAELGGLLNAELTLARRGIGNAKIPTYSSKFTPRATFTKPVPVKGVVENINKIANYANTIADTQTEISAYEKGFKQQQKSQSFVASDDGFSIASQFC